MAARRPGFPRSGGEPARAPVSLLPVSLLIERIGADGDGIGGGLFVPGTLPGERVLARPGTPPRGKRGELVAVEAASPERVTPPCALFGTCGGCALQHWRDDAYAAWKTEIVRAALGRAGFVPGAVALARTGPFGRRRVDLGVRRVAGGVVVGLHRAGGPPVDMTECHVLAPAIFALVAPLRDMLARLGGLRAEGSVAVNLLETGPDVLLRTDAALTAADRTRIAAFAAAQGVPRVCWALRDGVPEAAAVLGPVRIVFSGVGVTPPPGAFLQASEAGEAAIVAAVLAGLPERLRARDEVADLYAGVGTISFALAGRARVAAFEGDADAAAALRAAASVRAAAVGGRVRVTLRDLARQPLAARELSGFSAVVLDPPYAGAAAQMAAIAGSGVARVVYVSCNPVALARDAAVLRAAGYGLVSAVAIDQFLWSARVEAVCVFDTTS